MVKVKQQVIISDRDVVGDSAAMSNETVRDGPVRPHVAMVITELEPGGAERCLTELAVRLHPSRFVVQIIAVAPPPQRSQLVERLRQGGVPVVFLGAKHWLGFPRAWQRLRSVVRAQQPQIVHSFLFHANVLSTLASHAILVWGERVAEPRVRRLFIERLLVRRVTKIVCVSQAVREHLVRRGRFPPEKLAVIPNGIDLGYIDQAPTIPRHTLPAVGRRLIVYAGRLDQQKGIDWLLEAAKPLLSRLPEHDLVLAGDGPWRAKVERAAASVMAGRVHLLGWCPNIPGLLRHADLLLLPSRWEGMPNVVLEAMAVGVPILATRAEGVIELLGQTAAQQTVAFGDTGALVAMAERLICDQQCNALVRQTNRARVATCFSMQAMVQQYAALYDSLLANS